VGTLSGGNSSCATPLGPDCYGKFSVAWASGSGASFRLKDWLDSTGSGVTGVSGMEAAAAPLIRAGAVTLIDESCASGNGTIDPGELVTLEVRLRNVGLSDSSNITVTLLATNGITLPGAPQSYGALPANGVEVARRFSFVASGVCGSAIKPSFLLQDGTRNLGIIRFEFTLGAFIPVLAQNFDAVAAPALPPGWTTSAAGIGPWRTRAATGDTPPNVAYAPTAASEGDSVLVSPVIPIATTNARISFSHKYDVESGWDGGVLEVSFNGSPFTEIISAGGRFESWAYSGSLASSANPLSQRDAWTGDSGGFINTIVSLPAVAAGKSVQFRWRLGNDASVSYDGWYVDSVVVFDGAACCHTLAPPIIMNPRRENGAATFSFTTVVGQEYITEFKDTLDTNLAWVPFQTNAGDGGWHSVTNPMTGATNRFFRVRTQ
jgi:hypothetical protein